MDVYDVVGFLHDAGLQCDLDIVRDYWTHLRSSGIPYFQNHQASDEHIPMALYGDEATFATGESCTGIWLSFVQFRPKRIRQAHYLLCAIRTHLVVGTQTLFPIMARIVWSCNLCFDGLRPSRGPYGEQLGKKGQHRDGEWICQDHTKHVVMEIKGDWSWHRKVMNLYPAWNSIPVCYLCDAESRAGQNAFYHLHRYSEEEVSTVKFINTKLKGGTCSP